MKNIYVLFVFQFLLTNALLAKKINLKPGDLKKDKSLASWKLPTEPGQRIDQICFLMSHNAFSSKAHGFNLANQVRSIPDQLDMGVRGFMVDYYWSKKQKKLYFTHGGFGVTAAFMRGKGTKSLMTWNEFIGIIKTWMKKKANKKEFIFVIIEDHVKDDEREAAYDYIFSKANKKIYESLCFTMDDYKKLNGWPTLQWVKDEKYRPRLFFFTDGNLFDKKYYLEDPESKTKADYDHQWKYIIEGMYGKTKIEEARQERINSYRVSKKTRGSRIRKNKKNRRLLLLNFFTTALGGGRDHASFNTFSIRNLMDKVYSSGLYYDKSIYHRHGIPNFLALDFISSLNKDREWAMDSVKRANVMHKIQFLKSKALKDTNMAYIKPVSIKKINCFNHVAGDGEMRGHDCAIEIAARPYLTNSGKALSLKISCRLKENQKDWTTFEGEYEKKIYTAPKGYLIKSWWPKKGLISNVNREARKHKLVTFYGSSKAGWELLKSAEVITDVRGKDFNRLYAGPVKTHGMIVYLKKGEAKKKRKNIVTLRNKSIPALNCHKKTSGDAEIRGHPVRVTLKAELKTNKKKTSLILHLSGELKENQKDWTTFTGKQKYSIYAAPRGKTIGGFSPRGGAIFGINKKTKTYKPKTFKGSGVLKQADALCDTRGKETGRLYFNKIKLNNIEIRLK
ncbi:hypothetical protein ACFL35_15665 [Candidatus Riflebacteria bacterium]